MKVAVLKLGARIVFGSKVGSSGGSGEAASIVNMLAQGGAEVHCFTKVLNKDPAPPRGVKVHNLSTTWQDVTSTSYDALVVINGSVNFFGGAEDPEQLMNYKIMNNFNGEIFYVLCDPMLPLNQVLGSVRSKPWGSKYSDSDLFINKPVHVISQSTNLSKHLVNFSKNSVNVKSISQYDLQKFPLMFTKPMAQVRSTDVMYGGTFRGGRRQQKLIDFYFDYPSDISVEVFGKIKLEQFTPAKIDGKIPPLLTGPVDYSQMLGKMATAKAHIAIGDTKYPEYGMISQRIYESIHAGCLTFIDVEFDPQKRVYEGDSYLSDFLYVKSKDQVIDRLRRLSDVDRELIASKQSINFNETEYCTSFVNVIKDKL